MRRANRDALQQLAIRKGDKLPSERSAPRIDGTTYSYAAFATPPNTSHAAMALGVARSTVNVLRFVMAALLQYLQLMQLGLLLLMSAAIKPDFVISREAWDETSQRVAFRFDESLKESEQCSSWHILAYRVSLVVGWVGLPVVSQTFILPPVVLASTAGAAIFAALRGHPQYARLLHGLRMLRRRAGQSIALYETDSASGNEKLIIHMQRLMAFPPDLVKSEWCRCLSHQTHHIQASVVGLVGAKYLSGLYSMCVFLQAGNFNRLRAAVSRWADTVVPGSVRHGTPGEQATSFARCIRSYFEANYRFFETAQRGRSARTARWQHSRKRKRNQESGEQGQQKQSNFMKGLGELLQVWNGLGHDQSFVHYCSGVACCPDGQASLRQGC